MKPQRLALLGLLCLALPIAASAQRYTFVVTGDGRASSEQGRKGFDSNGVNQTVMRELVKEILKKKAKFVLFNGDLVLGYTTEDTFRSQLTSWLSIMKPLYAAGVHVYPVRGNHDASSKEARKVWDEVFTGSYALPQNGPEGEKNFTYSAKEGNALILGLDQWDTHEHQVNQEWLDSQLASNSQPIILPLGHEMAFMDGHHRDNLDNHEDARDAFIVSLWKAGGRVYFAGHDHFYDHMEIRDAGKYPGLDIHQFTVGTAGAPFYADDGYKGHNGTWQLTRIKHISDTYGYVLGKVNGRKVTLTFMGRTTPGVYKPIESFSYIAGSKPEG